MEFLDDQALGCEIVLLWLRWTLKLHNIVMDWIQDDDTPGFGQQLKRTHHVSWGRGQNPLSKAVVIHADLVGASTEAVLVRLDLIADAAAAIYGSRHGSALAVR